MKNLIYFLFILSIFGSVAHAQWTTNPLINTAISRASSDQNSPKMVTDGTGGAIVTWEDNRNGTIDVYAQRIDANGFVKWTTDGIAICQADGDQITPTIVSDGNGGAIIAWSDRRSSTNYDIYAQAIDTNGFLKWTTNGVVVDSAANNQNTPTIISDGAGGAIITWSDNRGGGYDIYAQRIDETGNLRWNGIGIPICTAIFDQITPTIISDGNGGAIVTWNDARSSTTLSDIYAQRIDANGTVKWTANGIAICSATGQQYIPTLVTDGSGGAIISWYDNRTFTDGGNIYVQRIDASGVVKWTANGVAVCTAANQQNYPALISDGSGGAIITWYDNRALDRGDIYAQRIDATGAVKWTANGVAICTAANDQNSPALVGDGLGGAIITWYDNRSGTNFDIYGQWININGARKWAANGLAISTASGSQINPALVSDGNNGAIIGWQDQRNGNYDIYGTRAYSDGNGPPAAPQNLVGNPGDGSVTLKWRKNTESDFLRYRIFQGTSPNPTTVTDSTTRGVADTSKVIGNLIGGITYYFRITAVDSTLNQSGYSNELSISLTDLTPPNPPTNLVATPSPTVDKQINLGWTASSSSDVTGYLIYRSTSTLSDTTGKRIAVVGTVTGWIDNPASYGTYFYVVFARDGAGNISVASNQANTTILPITFVITSAVYQNPVLSKYIDVVVISASDLQQTPIVRVWHANDSTHFTPLPMSSVRSSNKIYNGPYQFSTGGVHTIFTRAIGINGAQVTHRRIFNAVLVKPGQTVKILSTDGNAQLELNQNSIREETYFISDIEPLGKETIYRFGPDKSYTEPLYLELNYQGTIFPDAGKLFIYQKDEQDNWQALRSQVYPGQTTVKAQTYRLGEFKLVYDATYQGSNLVPTTFALKQNYPNPFNPTTMITYELPEDGNLLLTVYNLLGQQVRTLYDGNQLAGSYTTQWDGKNDQGQAVSSGIYFYRIQSGRMIQTKKMLLLR